MSYNFSGEINNDTNAIKNVPEKYINTPIRNQKRLFLWIKELVSMLILYKQYIASVIIINVLTIEKLLVKTLNCSISNKNSANLKTKLITTIE